MATEPVEPQAEPAAEPQAEPVQEPVLDNLTPATEPEPEPAEGEPAAEPEGDGTTPAATEPAEGDPEPEPEPEPEPAKPPQPSEGEANWQVAHTLMEDDPELKAQFMAAYRKRTGQQAAAPKPAEKTPEQAEQEAAQLFEQGRPVEATKLLTQYHPDVVQAKQVLAEREARDQADRARKGSEELREHYEKRGKPDDELRMAMKSLYDNGFTGNLDKCRVTALMQLERDEEAVKLSATMPKRKAKKQTAGGRPPAAAGGSAPRRAKNAGPSDPNISQGDIDYLDRQENLRRSDGPL